MDFMVNSGLLESTFFIKVGNGTGTSFTLTKNGVQYLVTAAHVVKGLKNKENVTIELYHEKQWKKIDGILFQHDNQNIDVSVIKLPFSIAPHYDIFHDGQIIYGQDLFFLGFPYGLHSNNDLNRNFPFAFIKKAVFSSVNSEASTGTIYFLDGHNNKGFSGGPVGYYDVKNKKTYIIAVISGYIPQEGEIDTPIGKLFYNENSGIILAYDIKHANEIIEKI